MEETQQDLDELLIGGFCSGSSGGALPELCSGGVVLRGGETTCCLSDFIFLLNHFEVY